MGWFRRSSGRHSYGVPVVATPGTPYEASTPAPVVTHPVPAPAVPAPAPAMVAPPPAPFEIPARLPDDRTTEQIGGKVAEVLWSYYGQQGAVGTPLAPAPVPAPVYDDSYLEAQFAAPAETAPAAYEQPVAMPAPVLVEPDPQPIAEAAPAPVTSVVALPSNAFRIFDRVAVKRAHVVQLGFVDGSTLELAGDDPAAKALRAAAQALTLRD